MKSINLQRTESLLMELIPQALSQLQNSKINSLPTNWVLTVRMENMMLLYILMVVILIKMR